MAEGKKKKIPKLKQYDLTEDELQTVIEGLNGEFFNILEKKVFPQRRIQLALTLAEAAQDMEQVWLHRGQIKILKDLGGYLRDGLSIEDGEVTYDNEDDGISAEDDHSV